MASINARQQVGHGAGGGNASIDNVSFSPGAWGGFVDDDHAFFANGNDQWIASLYDLTSRLIIRAVGFDSPFASWSWNTAFAGGGRWAGWLSAPGVGLYTSEGLHLPDAGLLGMGLNGELGYKPLYQSIGPSVCREPDDSEWTITPGHAYDLQLLATVRQFGRRRIRFVSRVCRSRSSSARPGDRTRISSTGGGGSRTTR